MAPWFRGLVIGSQWGDAVGADGARRRDVYKAAAIRGYDSDQRDVGCVGTDRRKIGAGRQTDALAVEVGKGKSCSRERVDPAASGVGSPRMKLGGTFDADGLRREVADFVRTCGDSGIMLGAMALLSRPPSKEGVQLLPATAPSTSRLLTAIYQRQASRIWTATWPPSFLTQLASQMHSNGSGQEKERAIVLHTMGLELWTERRPAHFARSLRHVHAVQ
jgi:hypothetical protein